MSTAGPFREASLSPIVVAILNEVVTGLRGLVATGQPVTIDLRRLPLAPHDLDRLRDCLGKGEVSVKVNALGLTTLQETALAGVWWVDHANDVGNALGSAIEVALVPKLLPVTVAEAQQAADTLQTKLESLRTSLQ